MKKATNIHYGTFYTERTFTFLFFIVLCATALFSLIHVSSYESFQISDWLINYQGGFIRRGLVGEILFQIEKVSPYNVRHAILAIDLIFYFLFFLLIFKIFIRHGWSLLGAMFPIVCCTTSMCSYRRDFMMLCISYLIFMYFFKYIKNNNKTALFISVMLMSLGIIVYEPVFFTIIPILALNYWHTCSNRSVFKTAAVFALPLACMLLSCLNNGTEKQSDIIWQSWLPYITPFGYDADGIKGLAVDFLGLTNAEVFKLHLESNFGSNPLKPIMTLLVVFTLAFFLSTHIPNVCNSNKTTSPNKNKSELGAILTFQLLAHLPLYTLLSCDYGRTIPMSIYSSFIIFHFSKENDVKTYVTGIIDKAVGKIMHWSDSVPLLGNTYFYIAVMLLFPFQMFVPSIIHDNIIMHSLDKIIKYVI